MIQNSYQHLASSRLQLTNRYALEQSQFHTCFCMKDAQVCACEIRAGARLYGRGLTQNNIVKGSREPPLSTKCGVAAEPNAAVVAPAYLCRPQMQKALLADRGVTPAQVPLSIAAATSAATATRRVWQQHKPAQPCCHDAHYVRRRIKCMYMAV